MTHRWLDRPWFKRGLLYHLYLVVLKDNYYRAKRASRRARVLARLALRWVTWRLNGKWALVPQVVDQQKLFRSILPRVVDAQLFLRQREQDNRSLLTGMVVALLTKIVPPLTGWERYKYAAQRKSNYKRGLPGRVLGKPVVYKFQNGVKIGVTEWSQDFVPRAEQLAARKRLKELKRASA